MFAFGVMIDLPGLPQDVWINNVEFKTYVHWKAPWYQSGLQLSYAVKARCKNVSTPLRNCTIKDTVTLCKGIRPQQGSASGQFVCEIQPVLYQFYPHTFIPVPYIAFVEASNVLGSTMSSPVEFTYNILSSIYSKYKQWPQVAQACNAFCFLNLCKHSAKCDIYGWCSFVLVLQRFEVINKPLRFVWECNNFALDINYSKIMNLLFYIVAVLYFFLFASTSDCSNMIFSFNW